MKNLLILLSFIALLTSCKTRNEDKSGTAKVNPASVITVDLSVKGMTCTGCENTIKTGVADIPGVVDVSANFKEGKATVKFDSTMTSSEQISGVIRSRGYEVTGHQKAE